MKSHCATKASSSTNSSSGSDASRFRQPRTRAQAQRKYSTAGEDQARPAELRGLSRVLHLHGEPLAQYRQGCLDLLRFGFMCGIEHTANDTFIDVQASRELGVIDVLFPYGEIERQLGSKPPGD